MHYVKPVDYQLHLNYNDVDHIIHVPYNPFVADITRFLNSSGDNSVEYVSPLPAVNVIAAYANAYFEANNIKITAKGYEPMGLEASGITSGVNEGANRGILMRGVNQVPSTVKMDAGIDFVIDGSTYTIGYDSPTNVFRQIAALRSQDNNALKIGGKYYPIMASMTIGTTVGVTISTDYFNGDGEVNTELAKINGLTIATVRLEVLGRPQVFGSGNNSAEPFSVDLPIDYRAQIQYKVKFIYSATTPGDTSVMNFYPDKLDILPPTFPGGPMTNGSIRNNDFPNNEVIYESLGTFSSGATDRYGTDSHTDYGRNYVTEQLNFKAASGVLKMLRPADAPRYLITAPRLVDVEPGDADHSKVCVLNDYLPYGVVMDFNTTTRTTIVPD